MKKQDYAKHIPIEERKALVSQCGRLGACAEVLQIKTGIILDRAAASKLKALEAWTTLSISQLSSKAAIIFANFGDDEGQGEAKRHAQEIRKSIEAKAKRNAQGKAWGRRRRTSKFEEFSQEEGSQNDKMRFCLNLSIKALSEADLMAEEAKEKSAAWKSRTMSAKIRQSIKFLYGLAEKMRARAWAIFAKANQADRWKEALAEIFRKKYENGQSQSRADRGQPNEKGKAATHTAACVAPAP